MQTSMRAGLGISAFVGLLVAAIVAACGGTPAQQTAQQTAAVKVATTVADDVCREIGGSDIWVELACAAEGVASNEVRVKMPRAEWRAVRARRLDAGPGL